MHIVKKYLKNYLEEQHEGGCYYAVGEVIAGDLENTEIKSNLLIRGLLFISIDTD